MSLPSGASPLMAFFAGSKGQNITESRNTKNTYDFLVQVRNFLWPLRLKVFRHKERYTFFLFWLFPPPHISCGTRSTQVRLAFASPESRPLSFGVQFWTHLTFFKSPKILRTRFRCMTSFTSPYLVFLFWHLWMTRPSPARAWTPEFMLHLSNPCTEPKGSQPN